MAKHAGQILSGQLHSIPIDLKVTYEDRHHACATGCGVFLYAETSTGCRWVQCAGINEIVVLYAEPSIK